MKFQKVSILLYFVFLLAPSISAQIANQARTAEEMIYIPHYTELVEAAKKFSPLLHSKDIEMTIKEMEWKAQKWEWTDFIQPFAEYRFGTVDNVVFSQTGQPIDVQATQANRFNLGARINLTIFDAITWRTKMVQFEKAVKLDSVRREEIELAIAQEVIRLWIMATTYREIVFLKSEYKVTQESNLTEARLRYETGEVPLMELARITEIATKAKEDYTLATKELREAVYLLMELVGRKDITKRGWKLE